MADVNFDGFVRMTWARFATLAIGVFGSGYMVMKKLNDIEHRLDNSVTVKQMHRWERDLKSLNPTLNVPSITDYESTGISGVDTKKGLVRARQ